MSSAKTASLEGLRWPVPASDLSGAGVPLSLDTLLQSLQLVGTDEDREAATGKSWGQDTPASIQVIKSGALGITKYSIAWVGTLGGVAGAGTAITGVVTAFTGSVGEPVAIALLASAALILSAVALALAIFVKGDLEARGIATAARHQGRADVAAAFLAATGAMPARTTPPPHTADGQALLEELLEALQFALHDGHPGQHSDQTSP